MDTQWDENEIKVKSITIYIYIKKPPKFSNFNVFFIKNLFYSIIKEIFCFLLYFVMNKIINHKNVNVKN